MPLTDTTSPVPLVPPFACLNGVMVGHMIETWYGSSAIDDSRYFTGSIHISRERTGFVIELAEGRDPIILGILLQNGVTAEARIRLERIEFQLDGAQVHFSGIFQDKGQPKPKSLCDRCSYLMRGSPSICNALHPTIGVDECADFRED
jgi:hypothetical protein